MLILFMVGILKRPLVAVVVTDTVADDSHSASKLDHFIPQQLANKAISNEITIT